MTLLEIKLKEAMMKKKKHELASDMSRKKAVIKEFKKEDKKQDAKLLKKIEKKKSKPTY